MLAMWNRRAQGELYGIIEWKIFLNGCRASFVIWHGMWGYQETLEDEYSKDGYVLLDVW